MEATPIFDGHNDVLLRMARSGNTPDAPAYDFLQENPTGHLDLPRARKGGLAGGLFAIFTPTPKDSPESVERWGMTFTEDGYQMLLHSAIDPEYAASFTRETIAVMRDTITQSQGQAALVTNTAELTGCIERGALAMVMHFEGAEAIREDLSDLEDYYRQGLRSLGIVWSRPNAFASGVPFCFPGSPDTGPGLTAAGRSLVRECNRLGILLDLAHINEKGFWEVAELTDSPLVVSHAAAHAICPSTRNLTDRQIDAVGQSGGLIGLIFEPLNVRTDGAFNNDTPLTMLVDHIAYIADRIGVNHVAFGSDFDGANMPNELKDAAGFQKLIDALRQHGFSAEDVEKIAYRNWLRTLHTAWKEV